MSEYRPHSNVWTQSRRWRSLVGGHKPVLTVLCLDPLWCGDAPNHKLMLAPALRHRLTFACLWLIGGLMGSSTLVNSARDLETTSVRAVTPGVEAQELLGATGRSLSYVAYAYDRVFLQQAP